MKQDEIASKIDHEQPEKIEKALLEIYNGRKADFSKLIRFNTFPPENKSENKSILKKIISKEKLFKISPAAAELGLLLLNYFAAYREREFYYRGEDVENKRFAVFKEKYDLNHLWDSDENYTLLELIFGTNDAPIVKKAWEKVPSMMYQKGYGRRSFRRPNDQDTRWLLQLNFIISLINSYATHSLTLAQSLQYDYLTDSGALLLSVALENDAQLYHQAAEIIQGKAESGNVSRALIKAMLLTDSPEAWELIGNLLLAAQRQEGLRQVILESLDETSIGAFRYILKLINAENLTRFSSVVRAIDVWMGLGWDAEKQSTVKRFVTLAEKYLSNTQLIENEKFNSDNAEVYVVLWALGVEDIDKCYPYLKEIYEKGNLEKKILVLYFVNEALIDEWNIHFGNIALNENESALQYFGVKLLSRYVHLDNSDAVFNRLETLYKNFPKKSLTFSGMVFGWTNYEFTKDSISYMMISIFDEEKEAECNRILSYYDEMAIENREYVVRKILSDFMPYRSVEEEKMPTEAQRDFAFRILSDRSSYIRTTAINVLKKSEIRSDEILFFEEMLKRKSSESRQFVIETIRKRSEAEILESAERLLFASNAEQRLAGLDLLIGLKSEKLQMKRISELVEKFSERKTISTKEQVLLDVLFKEEAVVYNAENGYGLFNPENRIRYDKPKPITAGFFYDNVLKANNLYGFSKSVKNIEKDLKDLHDLVWKYKDFEYEVTYSDGEKVKRLLGNGYWNSSYYHDEEEKSLSARTIFEQYPLPEVWEKWYLDSGLTEFDLFLINNHLNQYGRNHQRDMEKHFPKTAKMVKNILPLIDIPVIEGMSEYNNPIAQIIEQLSEVYPFSQKNTYLLDGLQYAIAVTDAKEAMYRLKGEQSYYSVFYSVYDLVIFQQFYGLSKGLKLQPDSPEFLKHWQIMQYLLQNKPKTKIWKDEKGENHNLSQDTEDYNSKQFEISFQEYLQAFQGNLCTEDELMASLFTGDAIRALTANDRQIYQANIKKDVFSEYPFVEEKINKIRERILEIELKRGDSATSVTSLALEIQSLYGIDYLVQILNGLGNDTLSRGYSYGYESKKEVLSQLLKKSQPAKNETQSMFDEKIKAVGFSEKRLVEIGMYAQQWLPFVQKYLGWELMESAAWWLHAHTNAYHSSETETEVAKYSQISMPQFADGVVDYHWFVSFYKKIGKERWQVLYDAAKYISDGNGHSRAKLYADVILGNVDLKEVTQRIEEKRNQDFVRVYGLLPLSKRKREKDLLERYHFLLKFQKGSKEFGSQRQASEKLAVEIAMDNLAFTAGYPDPIRLVWAMETEEAKSILQKAQTISVEGYDIDLQVDESGKAKLTATKDGKQLKSIPSKIGKNKSVLELKEYHARLTKQYSRNVKSLEEAMVRGDIFEADEMSNLMTHPVIAPMLKKLVLISENGMGFFDNGKLISATGNEMALGEKIRIAHCSDLYNGKQWESYQRYCFDKEMKQPFKQIFRELYIPTPDELEAVNVSKRYAGHQVQPKKTVALLKSRGWKVDYEEGLQKVFYNENCVAKLYALADWFSPADVESPTLETLSFLDRKTYTNIPFEKISPLMFSEVMRDLDLVVSLAHAGGVDPETSSSTIEMRVAIINEIVRLFKFDNVKIAGSHALIDGQRANYSVHLGSGVVHLRPGKSIFIIPVHSQHRGRIFLPFVDEDPKTAEIVAKIHLLANDKTLKDPTILEQLK